MVHSIVLPIVRQSMLVSFLIIAELFGVISNGVLVLQPFANFFTGLCVILMFSSQKKPWFGWICGCLEKKLIAKWINLKLSSLQQRKMNSMDLQNDKATVNAYHKSENVNIEMVSMEAEQEHNNKSNVQLNAMDENKITLTLSDPKWSSSQRQEKNKSSEEKEITFESITQSHILEAMMEMEHTNASITMTTD